MCNFRKKWACQIRQALTQWVYNIEISLNKLDKDYYLKWYFSITRFSS